ncbi:cupin domain-containing protein [Chryseobacterium sp. ISL-6]|uniref:cupin domain-containing protein n=1 Tax=Chryseobacterium sp. ISL-6 TaxID=2819143 RepID=UPI001BECDE00|nr:cupin domain-containing protein [Chryseobacterium sp. ISL-6]MBT2621147.1 cupin domain-containing protein [Chryseobacterium sp. ISL-6]
MNKIPRRVVTGIQNGKSTIVEDKEAENAVEHLPGLLISDIWNTQKAPASLDFEVPIPNTGFPQTPKNGTYFRYVVIPPDKDLGVEFKAGELHPMMHQTQTLDYIVILSGELHLIMEEGETLLKAGDIVIQRGTNHAWSNRSDQPCIQLAILMDGEV